jgi:AraC-like DNA-binding protein
MTQQSTDLQTLVNCLQQHASELVKPRNFYVGYPGDLFPLPDNVLMFHNRVAFDREKGRAHHRYVLVVTLQTTGQVIVDHSVFDLAPGMAILIHPWQLHRYANFQSQSVSWMFVTFDMPTDNPLNNLRNIPVPLDMTMLNALNAACECYLKLKTGQFHETNLIRLHLATFLQTLIIQQQNTTQKKRNRYSSSLISQVGKLIVSKMDQPLTVSEIAEELAISQSHLRNRFSREYNMGVLQYMHQLKTLHAMRLLCTTQMTISQIAQTCGFGSLFAFSRAFKHQTGISPRTYRDQNR